VSAASGHPEKHILLSFPQAEPRNGVPSKNKNEENAKHRRPPATSTERGKQRVKIGGIF
jgi:hypothetical protein